MAKVVRCHDVGFECDAVVRADDEEEALQMVAAHAREVHGLDHVAPEVVDKVKR